MPGSEDGDTNGMKTVAAALFLFICATLTPESPRVLRAPVWIYLEPVPGSFSESAPQKNPPVEELRETARYILSGMAGGWRFLLCSIRPPEERIGRIHPRAHSAGTVG